MTRGDGAPAEPRGTLSTPSDVSDARARWVARVAALARRLGVSVANARALVIALSTERGITVDEAIDALSAAGSAQQDVAGIEQRARAALAILSARSNQ